MKRSLASYAGFTLEATFAEFLMKHQAVLWAGDISHQPNRGPRMKNERHGIIVADYLVAGQHIQGWIDLKAKSTMGRRRDRNRLEQMIDATSFDNYLKLFSTGTQVYLIFLEIETSAILMGHLYNIASSQDIEDDILFGTKVKRFDRRVLSFVGNFTVPDGDLRKVIYHINWEVIRSMMVQLPLFPFEETIHA